VKLFEDMNAKLFDLVDVPDREAVERAEAKTRRALNLARIKPAITPEDVEAIIAGTFKDYPALRTTNLWFETARGLRRSRDGRPMRFLVLLGPPSRGKTVAACTVLAELGGYYVSAPELHRRASSPRFSERAKLEELHLGKLVVVDDLGTEDADARMESCLWDLVNARQVSGALTILTGNMSRDAFSERYGDRTVRRIEHQGAFVEVQGDDLRRKSL